MFWSLSHESTDSATSAHTSSLLSEKTLMSHTPKTRRSQSHTLSSLPSSRKSSPKRTSTQSGSFLTSIFATFTPITASPAPTGAPATNLKTHRSEVELRRDYLSPEREKEIGEIWEIFKRQSQEIAEDKLTSFPCISEYEYEDQDDEPIHR